MDKWVQFYQRPLKLESGEAAITGDHGDHEAAITGDPLLNLTELHTI